MWRKPTRSLIDLKPESPALREGIRANYDLLARRFDLLESPLEWLGLRRMRRTLLRRARGAVLEVAVGTGVNLPFYPPGVRLTAIDFSEGMLARARRRAGRRGREADFRIMDAEKLDFPDGSFDTVVSTLSTCTFPRPAAALREMARVLRKEEGAILLLEHGRSDRAWLANFQRRRAEKHFAVLGCRWEQEPLEIVREAGLRVVEHRRRFLGIFHWMVLRP